MKKKNSKGELILNFLVGSKRFFIMAIIASLAVTVVDMVIPQLVRYTVDTLIGGEKSGLPDFANKLIDRIGGPDYLKERLWIVAIAVASLALLSALFSFLQRTLDGKAAETLVERMRNLLFEHTQKLPFSWHMKNRTGDIIQRCTSDVDMVKNFLSEQLASIVRIVILVAFSLVFMYSMNVKLALIATVTLPIILLYTMIFGRRISEGFRVCDEEEGAISATVQENLTGVRVVRAFGREQYERDRFLEKNEKYTQLWVDLCRYMAGFWSMGDLVTGLQVMAILVFGTVFCVNGNMSAGQLIAFISYNTMLIWPIRRLGRMVSEMSKAGISLERLGYILHSEVEKDAPDATEPDMTGDICFEHVSFAYDGCPELLSDIDFEVKSGETVGILGGTGSGKSTLIHLLNRLYDIPENSGRITVGGVDIATIKRSHLRSNVGMVMQEPFLFSRTLAENIGIAASEINMEEIEEASRIACLDGAIEGFAKGYETFVGERGVTLSGGQKQRTAIARMLTRKTPIMVFDDSLSAVDAETDAKIRAALKETLGNATVVLISHRISTLMEADKIIVLDRGRIAEMGDHESLMQIEDGIYRRIAEIQSGSEENENE